MPQKPMVQDPLKSPAVPQALRDARTWVNTPQPASSSPSADMLVRMIQALIQASGLTDPAMRPFGGAKPPMAPSHMPEPRMMKSHD